MSYSVVYSTHTDNAVKLSSAIVSSLGPDGLLYDGKLALAPEVFKDADVIFVGFWTTKNSADATIAALLGSLKNKKIALFGSCGFGNEADGHFDLVKKNVLSLVDPSNTVLGFYITVGRIGQQFVEKGKASNWDPKVDFHFPYFEKFYKQDEGHPTAEEIAKAGEWAKEVIRKA